MNLFPVRDSLKDYMSEIRTLRVMLVEDHVAFRQALALLLSHEPDIEVVAQAGSLAEAREAPVDGCLDVVVLDLALPDGDGSDLIGELRRRNPGVSILVLSAAMGLRDLDEAVEAEVDAVLDKVESPPTIACEVRRLGRADEPSQPRGSWVMISKDPVQAAFAERWDNTLDEQTGHESRTDAWDSGDAYEPYVGRWSRLVAREFLRWLAMPPDSCWLDVGCGTGALVEAILALAAPREVVGIDPSPAYIAFARDRVNDPRVKLDVGDAQALPTASATFDAVVAGLVLNFVPEPDEALSEMVRVVRPGGNVAAYVWDYADGMQMMRYFWDAAGALDPRASELDEGRRFPLCKPGPLINLFQTAGLAEVEVRAIEVPTVFRDFEDYWSPFLGGQAPAPGYVMSLSQEQQAALRERIRASLPTNPEGEHHLTARAWAVRGARIR